MAAPKSNIVLISLDDAISYWHYKDVFGVTLETPSLDAISEQSTIFRAAYCQSPLCGPSRASFMSGRTPPETGIIDNKVSIFERMPAEDMWQVKLKEAGYFCSSGGKVHHGFRPLPEKVHEVLYSDERKGYRIDIKLRAEIEQSRSGGNGGGISTLNPKDDGYYHDAQSAKSFIKFIENYDGSEPFYREVGFYSPHSPFITPIRFKRMYPIEKFAQPACWKMGFERSEFANKHVKKNFRSQNVRNWKKSVRNYFSAYSHGDFHLGKVWRALKKSRFADNTIVIIVTDHGYHLGEGNRFGKSTLWEQSALVPFIIHDPQSSGKRIIDEPVALLDLGPTVVDYADLPPLDRCVGASLRPLVAGKKAPPPGRAVPTFNHQGASVRQGRYRFIRYNDGSTELYDLSEDWWQQKLLGPDHPEYDRMASVHKECCLRYGLDLEH